MTAVTMKWCPVCAVRDGVGHNVSFIGSTLSLLMAMLASASLTKCAQVSNATSTTSHLSHTILLFHHSKRNHICCSKPNVPWPENIIHLVLVTEVAQWFIRRDLTVWCLRCCRWRWLQPLVARSERLFITQTESNKDPTLFPTSVGTIVSTILVFKLWLGLCPIRRILGFWVLQHLRQARFSEDANCRQRIRT